MTNQLTNATSPYLLLHKDNPVDWHSWGPEALADAAIQNKPILLSIGYTACHWCHVMNHESFADAETAAAMNDGFINIKVDREERPDLDQIYQSAASLMGYQGGWPLTIFLTPSGVPFWVGGYFPKEERPGQPAFKTVLNDIAGMYRDNPGQVSENTRIITEQLAQFYQRDTRGPLDALPLDRVAMHVGQRFDIFYGGFTGAPKFPSLEQVRLLWNAFLRSGAPQFVQLVSTTLDNMLLGGLYDHIGGGFARYCTDERWLVPHFEKMLYDNAAMIDLLTGVWQYNRNPLCQSRVIDTIGWLLREMKTGDAFAASLDADSEGEEGRFYIWSEAEIDAALMGTFVQKFKTAYNVTRNGNFQGRNILHRIGSAAPFPQAEADEALFAKQREILLSARADRVRPLRDDKVLADSNGLAIAALANAGAVFGRKEWIDVAIKAFAYIEKTLGDGDRLAHSAINGVKGAAGFADDYANMARAALTLWEVTGSKRYLEKARAWTGTLNTYFWDGGPGGYFYTGSDGEQLVARARTLIDTPAPSANGMMVTVLHKLFLATGDAEYGGRVRVLLEGFAGEAARNPYMCGSFINGLEAVLTALQIVIIGPPEHPKTSELVAAVHGRALPSRLLLVAAPDEALPPGHPAEGKTMVNGQPTAYVCQHLNCSPPITSAVTLSQSLIMPPVRPGTPIAQVPQAGFQ